MPSDNFFLKMPLDIVMLLCTRVIQDSLPPTVNIFLGFGCEEPLSAVNVLPGASSTDSALNIKTCTCNLYSFACAWKNLDMKMPISKCCDPIFFCVSTCKFHVPLQSYSRCGVTWQQYIPAWEHGRSPRVQHSPGTWLWFWVLDCASASPCSPTGYRAGLSYCQQNLLSL